MNIVLLLVSVIGLIPSILSQIGSKPYLHDVKFPKVVLYGFEMELVATLSWDSGVSTAVIPYQVREGEDSKTAVTIHTGNFIADPNNQIKIKTEIQQGVYFNAFKIDKVKVSNSVSRTIWLVIFQDSEEVALKSGVVHGMPGPVTLLPIAVMLLVAYFSGQATVALLIGVFISSTFINGFNPLDGFLRTIDTYTINSLASSDHVKVIMFTFYLSAVVALIQKSAGAEAMALSVTKLATTRWRCQWATFFIGTVVFIDDLISCLVVGANMRVVTDKLFLSREKLSFIVHVTSAPLTSLSPVSSWIGFILGLISKQLQARKVEKDPLLFFIDTLPSRFFPIFIILLCAILMVMRRDFGPMLTAERRAYFNKIVDEGADSVEYSQDPLTPDPKTPRRVINSLIPIFIIISLTFAGLLISGFYSLKAQEKGGKNVAFNVTTFASNGDSYGALLYSSFFSCLICLIIYRLQGILKFSEGIDIVMYGFKDMVETMLVLVFAWAVGDCFEEMGVATFIVSALSDAIHPGLFPSLCCLLAAVMSFTTGTAWGTMAIMIPLALPLAYGKVEGVYDYDILVNTASGVFSGSLFGDLCSPISATSILTCTSVQIPVQSHLKTQLPYALLALVVSIVSGYLPVGFKIYPAWAGLLIGVALLIGSVFLFGVYTESDSLPRWSFIQAKLLNRSDPSSPDTVSDKELSTISKELELKSSQT